MELNDIITKLNQSIKNIDKITLQEKFSAYHQVKRNLLDVDNLLQVENLDDAKKKLLLCIRLLMEAPTKDKQLGLETLTKVDEVYKDITKLLTN